ncbi:MAG: hypothetical protein ACKO2L_05090, partial [Planctomycetaceae bacterium]
PLTLTEDFQIHLLQLKYLQVTADTVYNATGEQKWSWFLSHVDKLSLEDVRRLFPDPEFTEAAEVLTMIAQTPDELMLYHARLRAQRDESGRILQAKLDAEKSKLAAEKLEQTELELAQAKLDLTQAQLATEQAQLATEQAQLAAEQAEATGVLIGQIVLMQQLLKVPVSARRDLAACDDATLTSMANKLHHRLTSGIN